MLSKDPSESKTADLERLTEKLNNLPVALTLADTQQADMPLVLANKAFCDLTGYRPPEIIGRNCRFLQDDLENTNAREEVHLCIDGLKSGQVVFRNKTKFGDTFDNLLFLQPLFDKSGQVSFFLGSQFFLERSVTERTVELHLREIDKAVAAAIQTNAHLRAEQRRMLSDAAYAVARAWVTMN